ncbi:MAG: hypothetical protein ACE5HZ_00205 [Fidelibacterota bacterium]
MNEPEALAFVDKHGVVTESARSFVPSLAEQVAGGPIVGSWWDHTKGHEIFNLTRALRRSSDILVCRLVDGKITYVHRRLWPHLVRIAGKLDPERISAVREFHTSSGKHAVEETPFPDWVPEDVRIEARALSEEEAREILEIIVRPPSHRDKK